MLARESLRPTSQVAEDLREIARGLLETGDVDVFIGYEEGSLPLRTTPAFVTRADDVSRLVWGHACENNLAVYLPKFEGKVGVVLKGCDARTLVNLIVEKQVRRDRVKIVGVPCGGVIDRRKLAARLAAAAGGGRTARAASETEDGVILARGDGFEATVPVEEVLSPSCTTCTHPVPVVYDFLAGDERWARQVCPKEQAYDDVDAFMGRGADERFTHFSKEIERCIECFACRQACPLCYCPECFVDRETPRWVGRWRDLSDRMVFHLGRALHTAGRCVDCGACRRACPAGIDLRLLTRRMERDALEFFGYESGADLEAVPLLATYRRDDPDDFIL
ncbi:MAG: 4Fe-4S dicluster domain-containing protein [Firmicutes bacterium]|jgi:ferredoxin|nr:4Fe-4S dicluster domain-containing protein [Bacillota bacterium]MDH7494632.1 4Fe-4S dicluster domain-containing protein [Bacillota bacterium]